MAASETYTDKTAIFRKLKAKSENKFQIRSSAKPRIPNFTATLKVPRHRPHFSAPEKENLPKLDESLKVFRIDRFDLDSYVQLKCTLNESSSRFGVVSSPLDDPHPDLDLPPGFARASAEFYTPYVPGSFYISENYSWWHTDMFPSVQQFRKP